MSANARERGLPLVVPFHNERRRLPRLISTLRAQCPDGVTVVFVDNASSDGGAGLVHGCQEVRAGRWIALAEPTIGKFHAVKAATRFCIDVLGARHVALLDADSEPEDAEWFTRSLELVARHPKLGYVHSPIFYDDLQTVPRLFRAYRAYDAVLACLTRQVGWLANGNGFVCSADVLDEYFRRAATSTEFDLRCSLLALSRGLAPIFNAKRIRTSARRPLASQANLDAWCFYRRDFYSAKDINAPVKQNVDCRGDIVDVAPEKLDAVFTRRACKITGRHFVPFLLFDRCADTWARAEAATGVPMGELASLAPFGRRAEILFGDGFEEMTRAIEAHPVGVRLTQCLAESMRRHYDADESADDRSLEKEAERVTPPLFR